ncbi:hypothetical protein JCM10207_000435 [Rhodosporidiobolus poonsookiae]
MTAERIEDIPLEPVASTSSRHIEDDGQDLAQQADIVEQGEDGQQGPAVRQRRRRRRSDAPSYAQSEFVEIVRRQRVRANSQALKLPRHLLQPQRSRSPAEPGSYPPFSSRPVPSRQTSDAPLSDALPYTSDKEPPKLAEEWLFAGWGSMSYLELSSEEIEWAKRKRQEQMRRDGEGALGPWLASGVAGVAVAGSPLYAFPALVAVASIYSPISLLVATLLLSFWRPIMVELAAALPISGANYAYLLNSTNNLSWALLGASLTLLDDIATSVVAAATAASYISDQGVPGATTWLTIVLLVGIAAISLVGIKGSAGVTLATLAIHLITLSILFVSAIVHWGKHGNSTLARNWHEHQLPSASSIVKSLYQGVCIAFLGVTGFETAPDYYTALRPDPKVYPTVLRSLQIIAVCINAPLLLAVFAVLPMNVITGNASVLSTLGQTSAGKWLGVLVTVDAVLILCATVLAGLISAIALLQRLSLDGYLPAAILRPLPYTGVPVFVVALFTTLCIFVYTSSGASLSVVSNMFALVFLATMGSYPLSLLALRYNRPSLPRPRTARAPFLLVVFVVLLALALVAGVVWNQNVSVGFFAAYKIAVLALVLACAKKGMWMRYAWWVCAYGVEWARGAEACVRMMQRSKKGREVVLFVKGDELNTLFERISYVERNEETACVKLVHFYGSNGSRAASSTAVAADAAQKKSADGEAGAEEDGDLTGTGRSGVDEIPSELESNFRLLDEAFPSITIDLLFLQAPFSPPYIHALADRLGLSLGRCFMGSPSERWADEHEWGLRELGGVRVISG